MSLRRCIYRQREKQASVALSGRQGWGGELARNGNLVESLSIGTWKSCSGDMTRRNASEPGVVWRVSCNHEKKDSSVVLRAHRQRLRRVADVPKRDPPRSPNLRWTAALLVKADPRLLKHKLPLSRSSLQICGRLCTAPRAPRASFSASPSRFEGKQTSAQQA